MGATNFIDKATASTVKEAFYDAVQKALYDHGHSGYTGTIAEKPGYVLFDVPLDELPEHYVKGKQWNGSEWAEVEVLHDPMIRLENAMFFYRERQWKWEPGLRNAIKVDPFTVEIEPSVPHWLENKPEELAKYQAQEMERIELYRADARFFMEKMGRAKWEKMIDTYESKWDECVAIKTGENEWTFCGLASC